MHRKILIIDDHDDLATALEEVFSHLGHEVKILESRDEAVAVGDLESYDMVITDLDGPVEKLGFGGAVCLPRVRSNGEAEQVKAFKLCAANFKRDEFDEDELKDLIATVLDYKIRFVDTEHMVQSMRESIEFELPTAISLMNIVLDYLLKRVEKLGVIDSERSNLFVALDEAFVNAVKHGNRFDTQKLVRITAEISRREARFTIEDEGEGFNVAEIPDPLDPENLFKTSGRGVLFIYNIMDEVMYNERGNQLTMIKKAESEEGIEA